MDKFDLLAIVTNLMAIVIFGYILIEYAIWSTSHLWVLCMCVIVLSMSLIAYILTKGKDE